MYAVHASGGPAVREAARRRRSELHVVAVMVLISLDDEDLDAVEQRSAKEQVSRQVGRNFPGA